MLNNTDKKKVIRLTFKAFTIQGYTSGLQIKNITTGESIPTAKTITVEIAPYSYTLLRVLDDGN